MSGLKKRSRDSQASRFQAGEPSPTIRYGTFLPKNASSEKPLSSEPTNAVVLRSG
jgi:hypothetical protein